MTQSILQMERNTIRDKGYVLVVGDVICDMACRHSISATDQTSPVVLADKAGPIEATVGAAANCAAGIAALGIPTRLLSFVGKDAHGQMFREELAHLASRQPAQLVSHVHDYDKATTNWTYRLLDEHGRLFARQRCDSAKQEYPTTAGIKELIRECGLPRLIVLSDYGKGVLTPLSIDLILAYALSESIPVVIDPHPANAEAYMLRSGVNCVMTPNRKELEAFASAVCDMNCSAFIAAALPEIAVTVANTFRCSLLATLGAKGAIYAQAGSQLPTKYKTCGTAAVDTCGAGDSIVAGLVYGIIENSEKISKGAIVFDIAGAIPFALANADIAVGMSGAAPPPLHAMYRQCLTHYHKHREIKLETAVEISRAARAYGARVGVANGVFDLLHAGHLELLENAAAACDVLIVLLNSDKSASSIKRQPIIDCRQRVRMLSALRCVDMIVVFDDDTPREAIRAISPHVLFKGADYQDTISTVPGASYVQAYGGRAVAIPQTVTSTTEIIERIRRDAEQA